MTERRARMRYYVTADIHGFFTPFQDALEDSGYYEDPREKRVIICGDLFDRGEEAKELQSFVLKHKEELILIRGNHEDLFCEMVEQDQGLAYYHHVANGTYQTALMLTGYDPTTARIRHLDFASAARETPYYKEIIPSMLDFFETEKYIFVHGWIPCRDVPIYSKLPDWRDASAEAWDAARWINGMEAARAGIIEDGKTIVCGHWHCSYGHSNFEGRGSEFGDDADFTPYYGKGIIALDACTGHSGKVNVIVLED